MKNFNIFFILTLIINTAKCNVDVKNASFFYLKPQKFSNFHQSDDYFNITHLYYRNLILENNLLTFNRNTKKCEGNSKRFMNYYINSIELPNKMIYITSRNKTIMIDNMLSMIPLIHGLVQKIFSEMGFEIRKLRERSLYQLRLNKFFFPTALRPELQIPDIDIDNDDVVDNWVGQNSKGRQRVYHKYQRKLALPIQIHFRSLPYPQSTFMEFVTDRDRVWKIYNRKAYTPEHAGANDDLLYRMRHNLRHSLGLGHTENKKCIMFPTNIMGLTKPCLKEKQALHKFLCDRKLKIYNRHELK